MTGDALLDTTVVVAHLRGIEAVGRRLAETRTRFLPAVALGELHFGIRHSARVDENLAQLTRWLRAVVVVPAGQGTAERYGALKQELASLGTPDSGE